MKKIIFVFSIMLLIGVVVIIYRFYGDWRPSDYSGQKLSYLGDSEVVNRYPQEFTERNKTRLNTAISFIKTDPANIDYWLEIGLVKKIFDNYVGARDAWEYVKLISPNSSLAYFNLGNLYGLYLKDNQKAEENYLRAIDLDSQSPDMYLGLAEFYRDFYKEKYDQVDDVLLKGLAVAPKDLNLHLTLALYYKATGNSKEAIKYFEKFLQLPDISGAQKDAIQSEIKNLR